MVEFIRAIEPQIAITADATPTIAGIACRLSLSPPPPDQDKLEALVKKKEEEVKQSKYQMGHEMSGASVAGE